MIDRPLQVRYLSSSDSLVMMPLAGGYDGDLLLAFSAQCADLFLIPDGEHRRELACYGDEKEEEFTADGRVEWSWNRGSLSKIHFHGEIVRSRNDFGYSVEIWGILRIEPTLLPIKRRVLFRVPFN